MQSPSLTAGQVVSQMLVKYNKAVSIKGTITLNQKANEVSVTAKTDLQYEKPSKLYINQVMNSREPRTSLVTSDGTRFSYPSPVNSGFEDGKRLIERVDQNGVLQDVRMIFTAVARMLVDRNPPLEIAIGRTEDLQFLRDQWATMEMEERDGAYRITGQWRESRTQIVSGRYLMVIDKEYDLKRYTIVERRQFQLPDGKTSPVIDLSNDWTVDLKIDAPVDPALFRVKL